MAAFKGILTPDEVLHIYQYLTVSSETNRRRPVTGAAPARTDPSPGPRAV
jgi:hypothetical protein